MNLIFLQYKEAMPFYTTTPILNSADTVRLSVFPSVTVPTFNPTLSASLRPVSSLSPSYPQSKICSIVSHIVKL